MLRGWVDLLALVRGMWWAVPEARPSAPTARAGLATTAAAEDSRTEAQRGAARVCPPGVTGPREDPKRR
ncbi:hypothetical protein Shyhy02_74050 [Streptomyces hygroscopicus subsp. hygroscopicus]|nr:hypothetical protein Shyhy02_74050 [Streptomyces hygroscopicus subsp. hygroscopicus]